MPQRFPGANHLIEGQLAGYLGDLEMAFDADCLTYVGPIAFGADDDIRDAVEEIEDRHEKLIVILQTDGGFAETARRISDTVRHFYSIVDFLVPSHAMSAGTILVMSGDDILMDYYSILGPIDPQIEDRDGNLIPALGYLVRYEELIRKARRGNLSEIELEILVNFDQGRLYSYEQARDLSRSLLEEWLCNYKWKNWIVTETKGIPVTEAMKRKRAREIAKKLNDVKLWNSHGIGINMRQLKDVLQLKITDFGQMPGTNEAIRRYHNLFTDYMGKCATEALFIPERLTSLSARDERGDGDGRSRHRCHPEEESAS